MTNTTIAQARGWNRQMHMNGYAQSTPHGQYQSNGQFFTNPSSEMYNENFDPSMAGLSQSMAGMMLQGVEYAGLPKQNVPGTANGVANFAGVPAAQADSRMYYSLPNGSVVYSNANGAQNAYPQYLAAYGLNAAHAGQLQQAPYPSLLNNAPATPNGPAWLLGPQLPQEVPELAAAGRTSLSSNEADSPQTPMFNNNMAYQSQMLGSNQHSSDLAIYGSSNPDSPVQIAKQRNGEPCYADFRAWTTMSPAIPLAIPAIDSPGGGRGSLEQIMHNPNATTNVYVRGLHPETSDEMLLAYGKRFGDVDSAKSIIDTATGSCKG